MKEFLTQSQAAKIIGVSQPRVSVLVRAGRLPASRVGRQTVIRRADAVAFRKVPRPPGRRASGRSLPA